MVSAEASRMEAQAEQKGEKMSQKHTTVITSDEPVKVIVQTEGRWFRLFASLVESGTWARMSDPACRVYVALAKHCDERWIAWPSLRTLSRLAGCSAASVKRALRELQAEGLLNRRRGGGRCSTVYELLDSAATPSLPFGVSDSSAGSGVSHQQAHGGAISRLTGEPRTKPVEQEPLNSSKAAAVGELVARGVEQPIAVQLVERFGVAAAKSAVRKAEAQGAKLRNRAGFIRAALEQGFAGEGRRAQTVDEFLEASRRVRQREAEASQRAADAFYAGRLGQRST